MLMLENLKKKSQLTKSLKNYLNTVMVNGLIVDGKIPVSSKMQNQFLEIISIFDSSDITFVGASHGNVMSPLFALNISPDENSATLDYYLTETSLLKSENIENEITMLAVAISVHYPGIKKIFLPKVISEFGNSECVVKCLNNKCVLTLK